MNILTCTLIPLLAGVSRRKAADILHRLNEN